MKQDLELKSRIKEILKIIHQVSPGNSVELRIPPYGAIQCVAGSRHRRGTPPNSVEMSGEVLIQLIKDPNLWGSLCDTGEIRASGIKSDLSEIFNLAAKKYKNI